MRHLPRRVPVRIVALVAALLVAAAAPAAAAVPVPIPASADWLSVVNYYRAMAGLPAVSENATWSAGDAAHARYMLLNGTITHDEVPGAPGYSQAGDDAANSGNVAVTSIAATTARQHIEQWVSGPFHLIGIITPGLRQVGFGQATDPAGTPWRSAAALDVTRGVDSSVARPAAPVLFPGNGTTTHLSRLSANESPDARTFCGWNGVDAGQPLMAIFPAAVGTASATLTGPAGPVTTCSLTGSNTSGVAQSLLGGSNAVAVIPRTPLVAGTYRVTITTSSGASASWSFSVDPSVADGTVPTVPTTPLPTTSATAAASAFGPMTPVRVVDTRTGLGSARLGAGVVTPLDIAGRGGIPANASAVSANVTVVGPRGDGYLTMFPCGTTPPEVSTLNFPAGRTLANAALLPLDAGGDLCAVSTVATDLLVDVNGSFSPSGTDGLVPTTPARILDTRTGLGGASRQPAGGTITLQVRGVAGVPANATAVALTVTAVNPGNVDSSYVTVSPCGARPNASNLNLVAGETRPNMVIVPVSPEGKVCLFTTAPTDLLADLSGWFVSGAGRRFTPLSPIRVVDTRQADGRVNGGSGGNRLNSTGAARVKFAGNRGIPAGASVVSANLTVAGSTGTGYVTAYPCGTVPDASNLNYVAAVDTAGAAQLVLDAEGYGCFVVSAGTHLIVDVNGAWA